MECFNGLKIKLSIYLSIYLSSIYLSMYDKKKFRLPLSIDEWSEPATLRQRIPSTRSYFYTYKFKFCTSIPLHSGGGHKWRQNGKKYKTQGDIIKNKFRLPLPIDECNERGDWGEEVWEDWGVSWVLGLSGHDQYAQAENFRLNLGWVGTNSRVVSMTRNRQRTTCGCSVWQSFLARGLFHRRNRFEARL